MEMKVAQNVVINLPAGEIFAYVAEFENLADWSGAVIAVRKSPSGAIHVGTTVLITIRFLGRWVQSTYEVVECEPGHHITLKSIAGIAPCVFNFLFEPLEAGRTRLSFEAVIQQGAYLGLAGQTAASATRRQIEHDLLTLKEILETGALIDVE
jgi:uncharacterized membrane protein